MSDVQSTEETWKDCPGHPVYQVSNWGRVRSFRRKGARPQSALREVPVLLKLGPNGNGYIWVMLEGQTHHYVHRLVLEAFVGPCPPGMQARHVHDASRNNNRLENLAWGTPVENHADKRRHGTLLCGSKVIGSKLTDAKVLLLRKMVANGEKLKAVARRFGVSMDTVSHIARGNKWKHVGGPIRPNGIRRLVWETAVQVLREKQLPCVRFGDDDILNLIATRAKANRKVLLRTLNFCPGILAKRYEGKYRIFWLPECAPVAAELAHLEAAARQAVQKPRAG